MCCFSNIYNIYLFLGYFRRDTLSRDKPLCLCIFFRYFSKATINCKKYIRSTTEIAMKMNVVVLQRSQFFEVFAVSLITGQRPNAAGETPSSGEYPKKYKGKVFVERILLCFLQSPEQSKVTGKQQEKDDTFQAQEQGAEELFVLAREAKIVQPIAQVASVYCQCSGALDNILLGL